jgi:hypothetical protein
MHIPSAKPDPPTPQQVEKLRLLLSSYQDGMGMLSSTEDMPLPEEMTLPGWRDFERTCAVAFGGKAQESKFIFDVLVPRPATPPVFYGISCKMKKALDTIHKGNGRAYMELTNSSKQFWDHMLLRGITKENYRNHPEQMGIAIMNLLNNWHEAASATARKVIDLSKSYYLVLSYNNAQQYQLHQFSLELPDPQKLKWTFPTSKSKKDGEKPGARLAGADEKGTVFEWYGNSGGQLKYYPFADTALWASDIFQLEPLPVSVGLRYGLISKVVRYFPTQWKKVAEELEQPAENKDGNTA